MDSLNPQGIDQRFDNCSRRKRMRGISNVTPSQGSAISAHDSKLQEGDVHKLNSEASLLEPPSSESSDHSSGETVRQIYIPVGDDSGMNRRNSTYVLSHGLISVIGRRRVMEDTFAVAKFDSYHFFAVYDGHGGTAVANACRDRLHQLVKEEVEEWRLSGEEVMNWEKVITVSFSKMDQEVGGGQGEVEPETGGETTNTTGSTAVVVLVGEEEIVVANCGDSRAVLGRGGAAVPLSRDHKPDRPDEIERIEAAGGRIINWNGSRVLGVLATSRSIGDYYLKPYVIPEPEVTVCKRTESDEFIVIATDGLWDVVSNEFACEVVRRCLDGQIKRRLPEGFSGTATAVAATMLAELAMAQGSKDNISVIVVELNK